MKSIFLSIFALTAMLLTPQKYNPLMSTLATAPTASDAALRQSPTVLRHNPHNNTWVFTPPEFKLKQNPYNNTWSYQNPKSQLRHNPHNNTWTFEPPEFVLKHNPHNNTWSYQNPKSQLRLRHNTHNSTWEWDSGNK
jgi:hypothetical protein